MSFEASFEASVMKASNGCSDSMRRSFDVLVDGSESSDLGASWRGLACLEVRAL